GRFAGQTLLLLAFADEGCRDVTQESDGYLAVEKDVLDELHDLETRGIVGKPDQRGVPDAPGAAIFIKQAAGIEGIRLIARGWTLRESTQLPPGVSIFACGAGKVATHHVQLIVEYKQVARDARLRVCRRLKHLDGIDVKKVSIDLIHCQECRRHAASTAKESASIHSEFFARECAQFL